MAPKINSKWSSVQAAAVLACADHCVQHNLDLTTTIPNLMKAMEFPKSWPQISSKLGSLNKAYNRTVKDNSLTLLRKNGLGCLDLPAGLAAQVDNAQETLQDSLNSLSATASATAIADAAHSFASIPASIVDTKPPRKRSREPDVAGGPGKAITGKRSRELDETTAESVHYPKRVKSDASLDIDDMEHSELLSVDNESQVWNSEDRLALGLSASETPKPTSCRQTNSMRRWQSVSPYQLRGQLKAAQPKNELGLNERKELEALRIKTAEQDLLLNKLRGDLEDAHDLLRVHGAKIIEMGHAMMAETHI